MPIPIDFISSPAAHILAAFLYAFIAPAIYFPKAAPILTTLANADTNFVKYDINIIMEASSTSSVFVLLDNPLNQDNNGANTLPIADITDVIAPFIDIIISYILLNIDIKPFLPEPFLTEEFKLSNALAISLTTLSAFAPDSLFIPLLTKYITRPATVVITSFTSDNLVPIVSIIV